MFDQIALWAGVVAWMYCARHARQERDWLLWAVAMTGVNVFLVGAILAR